MYFIIVCQRRLQATFLSNYQRFYQSLHRAMRFQPIGIGTEGSAGSSAYFLSCLLSGLLAHFRNAAPAVFCVISRSPGQQWENLPLRDTMRTSKYYCSSHRLSIVHVFWFFPLGCPLTALFLYHVCLHAFLTYSLYFRKRPK